MAEFQAKKKDALMCLIGDEDTVTGFLLAGVGEIDTKKNSRSNAAGTNTGQSHYSTSSTRCTSKKQLR